MSNNKLDKNLTGAGWCCPHAFIRLMTRPSDSISRMAKAAQVGLSCIKENRAKFRDGELPCAKRSTCLRALWLSPSQRAKQDKLDEERKLAKENANDPEGGKQA